MPYRSIYPDAFVVSGQSICLQICGMYGAELILNHALESMGARMKSDRVCLACQSVNPSMY